MQLLAAIWHAFVLIFDIYKISQKSNATEIFCNVSIFEGCAMHRFSAFSHSTLSKTANHKFFLSIMICNWSLIHRKFKSVPYPIAAHKLCFRS